MNGEEDEDPEGEGAGPGGFNVIGFHPDNGRLLMPGAQPLQVVNPNPRTPQHGAEVLDPLVWFRDDPGLDIPPPDPLPPIPERPDRDLDRFFNRLLWDDRFRRLPVDAPDAEEGYQVDALEEDGLPRPENMFLIDPGLLRVAVQNGQDLVEGGARSELRFNPTEGPNYRLLRPLKEEFWYHLEFSIPDYWAIENKKVICFQCHQEGGEPGESPPLAFMIWGERFRTQWYRDTLQGKREGDDNADAGPIVPDRRNKLTYRAIWGTGPEALIEGWLNGVKIFFRDGPQGYEKGRRTYESCGMYWPSASRTSPNRSKVFPERVLYLHRWAIGDKRSKFADFQPGFFAAR